MEKTIEIDVVLDLINRQNYHISILYRRANDNIDKLSLAEAKWQLVVLKNKIIDYAINQKSDK
jgi:hypothetical protein